MALKIIDKGLKVLVVAEGAHSIRAKLVWQELAREKNITVYFASNEYPEIKGCKGNNKEILKYDTDNLMWMQRSIRIWTVVNMILFPFYRFFPGVKFFTRINFHQPV